MSRINVIFDLDGTLIDTALATVPACQDQASAFGLPPLSADLIRQTIGWANPEFYRRLYPDLEASQRAAYAEAVEKSEAGLIARLGPDLLFPGVADLLLHLQHIGCFLAIASTGSHGHVSLAMASARITGFFESVNCGQPDKETMVARIRLKDPDGTWLLVGDKDKDANAARANHILSVGARYGYGSASELLLFDRQVEQPAEVWQMIGQLA